MPRRKWSALTSGVRTLVTAPCTKVAKPNAPKYCSSKEAGSILSTGTLSNRSLANVVYCWSLVSSGHGNSYVTWSNFAPVPAKLKPHSRAFPSFPSKTALVQDKVDLRHNDHDRLHRSVRVALDHRCGCLNRNKLLTLLQI